MAEDATDILMMVTPTANNPLPTGRTVDVTSGDTLLLTGQDMPSRFTSTTTCYLTGFGMAAGIALRMSKDDDDKSRKEDGTRDGEGVGSRKSQTETLRDRPTAAARQKEDGEREERRQQTARAEKDARQQNKVPAGRPQPVKFQRRMDVFSPTLLSTMQAGQDLASISIVKRKATGNMAGGVMTSGDAFLRLDFIGVLMLSLTWEDDEAGIKETGTFIYRKLLVQYLPQDSNGALGSSVSGTYSATVGGGSKGSS